MYGLSGFLSWLVFHLPHVDLFRYSKINGGRLPLKAFLDF